MEARKERREGGREGGREQRREGRRAGKATLSPKTLMTGPVGPMNLIPISLRVLGRRGFSEA
jgi:trimethylamine:corrinoid methyltransferase-like protein